MKKTLVMMAVVAGFLFAGNANAQSTSGVAVHAGYSPETWFRGDNSMNVHSYLAGVDFRAPIIGGFGITVGAQGRWSTESGEDAYFVFDTNHSTNIVAAEIPLLLNYCLEVFEDFKITPFAGAKFTYYIKGTSRRGDGHHIYEWFEDDKEVNGLQKPMNHFGVSATFGLDVSYQHFHLYGGYSRGLNDLDNYDNTKTTTAGAFFGLMVGF